LGEFIKWIGVCPDRRPASTKVGAFRFLGEEFESSSRLPKPPDFGFYDLKGAIVDGHERRL
jgi:hypothetical protein